MELLGSLFTENAIYVPANSIAVEGRAAICALYTDPPPEDLGITVNRVDVENDSAWVYAFSHRNVDGRRLGNAFVDVWRRNNDMWQISACIVNSSDGFVLD